MTYGTTTQPFPIGKALGVPDLAGRLDSTIPNIL